MNYITHHMTNCVRQFMTNFDQKMYSRIDDVPCETALLRSSLISEESKEYHDAFCPSTDELDAIVDLLYVTIGTNLCLGVDVQPLTSGQVIVKNLPKQAIYAQVSSVTQDLDSRFPCAKRQYAALGYLTQRLLDIAAMVGYNLQGAFDAVHKANMGKLWNNSEIKTLPSGTIPKKMPDGWLVRRADGKVLKPPSFKAADLTSYLHPSSSFSSSSSASAFRAPSY